MVPIRGAAALDEDPRGLAPAGDVVDVDVRHAVAAPRAPDEDARQPDRHQVVGQAVVAVVRGDHGTVHVSVREVTHRARALGARRRQQQHELEVAGGQHPVDPAQGPGEERVAEHALVRLRDDDRDRFRAARDQRPRGRVRHVAQRPDGLVDRPPGGRADPRSAVDRAGRRGARDARDTGHLVEGRLAVHRSHGSDPAAATRAYQCALDFGVRCWVW
jgi:hypothetical protein